MCILAENYDTRTHFISDQTFTDTMLAGHSVILNMLVFTKYDPNAKFCPWFFRSDSCEVLFSCLQGFTKETNNFNFLEMLDIAERVLKLLELKHRGKRLSAGQPNVTWPRYLLNEITDRMKSTEREVLKTMEELGMVPGLRVGNAVYKNDRTGEITVMNTASSAITAERSQIPDENNVATFEELFHFDNNILLSSLQEENNARLDGIADIILSSQCPEKESEKEVDGGDPENCELYKVGMCKFRFISECFASNFVLILNERVNGHQHNIISHVKGDVCIQI